MDVCIQRATISKDYEVGLLLGTTPQTRIGRRENYFFKYRIEAAEWAYRNGIIQTILISGDENSLDGVNEVECMRDSLVARGVPSSAIVLDGKGFRTLDAVVRANKVYGYKRFVVISQQFHNERAIYLAKHLDLDVEDVIGINAKSPKSALSTLTYIREALARVKVFVDIFTGKQPQSMELPQVANVAEQMEPDSESLALGLDDSLANVDPMKLKALDLVCQHEYMRYKDMMNRKDLLSDLTWSYHTSDSILALYDKENIRGDYKARQQFFENLIDKAKKTRRLGDGEGETTMSIVQDIDTEIIFDRFLTYVYLQSLFHLIEDTGELMHQLNREYSATECFCDYAIDFCMKMSSLMYWGGSISSIVGESSASSVRMALLELYKEEVEHPLQYNANSKGLNMINCSQILSRSSQVVIDKFKETDMSYLAEDEIAGYNATIVEAEQAKKAMLSAAFDSLGFISYRKDRISNWIATDESKFVKASNQRALNFLSRINDAITSITEP